MIQDTDGNTIKDDQFHTIDSVHINDLPPEVLLNIFCNLSPVDLRDIRLVCRQWNNVVLDKAAWTKAFDNRFQTGSTFASVTGSHYWILEYFGRVAQLRTWAKAKSVAKLYTLVNSEYGLVDRMEADFVHDRLLTYSKTLGTFTSCTLSLGKNQVFIPDNQLFSNTLAFDVNWNYLCIGKASGEIYLKNLITATSSASSRLSITLLASAIEPIISLKLNPECDRHRERQDVIALTNSGLIKFLSLNGKLISEFHLHEGAINVNTDFKKWVTVISALHITVIDYVSKEVLQKIPHLQLEIKWCDVDFGGMNVVMGNDSSFKVFKITPHLYSVVNGSIPIGLRIIGHTLQENESERDLNVAGGDGRLYALTLSDGSVVIFELREATSPVKFKTRIRPFDDDRTPQNINMYTKVALNSSVIAIGALADWIHFYDSHSGQYLREGAKVSRKLTRNGMLPILYIKFAPKGASGVVVSGDVVQYFRYGDILPDLKRPNAPQAVDLSNKRAIKQHIKTQLEEYDELQFKSDQAAALVDKFNGTTFDSEQEELRVAMALSASSINVEDTDLEKALALLREDISCMINKFGEDEDKSWNETKSSLLQNGSPEMPVGSSAQMEMFEDVYDSEEETLQRVLRLSLLES